MHYNFIDAPQCTMLKNSDTPIQRGGACIAGSNERTSLTFENDKCFCFSNKFKYRWVLFLDLPSKFSKGMIMLAHVL